MNEKKQHVYMKDLRHYNPAEQQDDSETTQGFAATYGQVSNMYADGTIDTMAVSRANELE